jgi:Lrp/AsnC family leucine-responsive transcriptional regulator
MHRKGRARAVDSEDLMPPDARFHALDRVDCAIVRVLQQRGRDSFAEIGKEVGLSATSVAERIRRLERDGVIAGYRAEISAAGVGYPVMAFILARPIGPDARFAKVAAERPEILECYRVTGDMSFVARAVVRDVQHLEELLDHLEPSSSYIVTLVVLSASFGERPVHIAAVGDN